MADYSENKPIWPGSSSFTAGNTPFGFFDNLQHKMLDIQLWMLN